MGWTYEVEIRLLTFWIIPQSSLVYVALVDGSLAPTLHRLYFMGFKEKLSPKQGLGLA